MHKTSSRRATACLTHRCTLQRLDGSVHCLRPGLQVKLYSLPASCAQASQLLYSKRGCNLEHIPRQCH